MINLDLGYTYLADRLSASGESIQSALDHIYISMDLKEKTREYKLEESSTDHLPIMLEILCNTKSDAPKKAKFITKRSMKNFNTNSWNETLVNMNWSRMYEATNIHEKTTILSEIMNEALDILAPVRTVVTD